MGLQDFLPRNEDGEQAAFMRKKRVERMAHETLLAQQAAEAERQTNVDAMQQAALQYQQQQQGVQQGYEQDATNKLDQFGLMRLLGDFNIGHDAATQGLSYGMSQLSGDTARANTALMPTGVPQAQQAQQALQGMQPSAVGQASMKPLSLYESLVGQANSAADTISANTKEAKDRAKALLKVIRNAR